MGTDLIDFNVFMMSDNPGMDLPRVELSAFDGSPAAHWKFISQFQTYMAAGTYDGSQRLLCLLH